MHRPSIHLSSPGMEPVAVAVRGNSEAWVVNHLSDSVSIAEQVNPRIDDLLLQRARATGIRPPHGRHLRRA